MVCSLLKSYRRWRNNRSGTGKTGASGQEKILKAADYSGEETQVFIIAGLGNPGKKYEHTRHNCGYEALDVLADRYHIACSQKKFRGLCGTGTIEGVKVLLLKPETYMNLSGESLREACDFFKADPERDLIVLCDDISLDVGRLRVRPAGSAGGHNGLKNIIAQLGTDRFTRIRIGVGEKPEGYDLADYVLGHFHGEEALTMADSFDRAARAAAELLTQDAGSVMSRYNSK